MVQQAHCLVCITVFGSWFWFGLTSLSGLFFYGSFFNGSVFYGSFFLQLSLLFGVCFFNGLVLYSLFFYGSFFYGLALHP